MTKKWDNITERKTHILQINEKIHLKVLTIFLEVI